MNNFQVKHGQCDSIILPKHFILKALSNCQISDVLAARIFTFYRSWNLSTNLLQNSMSCTAYLQRGQDYFKFYKSRNFFICYDNQVLLGLISQCGQEGSCTLQKGLPVPFSLAKKRIYLDTQLKGCCLFSLVGIG